MAESNLTPLVATASIRGDGVRRVDGELRAALAAGERPSRPSPLSAARPKAAEYQVLEGPVPTGTEQGLAGVCARERGPTASRASDRDVVQLCSGRDTFVRELVHSAVPDLNRVSGLEYPKCLTDAREVAVAPLLDYDDLLSPRSGNALRSR